MNIAIIGVGSNISPQANIGKARDILSVEQTFIGESRFITTTPIGYTDQPDFINGAFKVGTDLTQGEFVTYLKEIEQRLGRKKNAIKYGPRIIDLDLVVWNGIVVDPDYYTRDFLQQSVDETGLNG
jgi:2-amino-4-hydroxy-6-hydroxymethyldihydropteridine diphosphokinase